MQWPGGTETSKQSQNKVFLWIHDVLYLTKTSVEVAVVDRPATSA